MVIMFSKITSPVTVAKLWTDVRQNGFFGLIYCCIMHGLNFFFLSAKTILQRLIKISLENSDENVPNKMSEVSVLVLWGFIYLFILVFFVFFFVCGVLFVLLFWLFVVLFGWFLFLFFLGGGEVNIFISHEEENKTPFACKIFQKINTVKIE